MQPENSASNLPFSDKTPWFKLLNRYHWFVLVVAALGWLFDTMDQQLFILAASPAMEDLLGSSVSQEDVYFHRALATSIFIAGWATGGFVFGLFGDRIGRARTMIITILIYSLFTGLSALSVGFLDFAFYRFLAGIGVGGEFAAGVALVAEVMPARARPYALGLLQALSAVGNAMAAVINLLIPPGKPMDFLIWEGVSGWRLMFLVGILPAILVVFIRRGLKEPDSWVQAKQKSTDDFHKQMGDLRELFGNKQWRYHAIVGLLMAMVGVMGLWGVTFWIPELIRSVVQPPEEGSFYVGMGFLVGNIGLFLGVFGFSLITGKIGRRRAFAVAYSLALLATIVVFGFMADKNQVWWMMPLLLFSNLMVFGGFAIYFPELFPTRLRATGTGFCYNVARYLAALAPYALGQLVIIYNGFDMTLLSSLGGVDTPLRYAALSVASIYLLGLVLLLFAPETKDKPLPE